MAGIKQAASIIVCAIKNKELQVLMLQRSSFGFYKDLTVFPGGKIDGSDLDPRWATFCNEPINSINSSLLGAKVASIRESFEEVGLLLLDRPVDEDRTTIKPWRSKSSADSKQFLEMFQGGHLSKAQLETAGLIYFSNWVSPEHFEKNRFDTKFFLKLLPNTSDLDQVTADGRESVSVKVQSPSSLLAAFRRKGRPSTSLTSQVLTNNLGKCRDSIVATSICHSSRVVNAQCR